jgi:hypothetical protein
MGHTSYLLSSYRGLVLRIFSESEDWRLLPYMALPRPKFNPSNLPQNVLSTLFVIVTKLVSNRNFPCP